MDVGSACMIYLVLHLNHGSNRLGLVGPNWYDWKSDTRVQGGC